MALLTKDAILAAVDLPTERVSVPEWGGDVLVRGLDGRDRDAFEASLVVQAGGPVNLANIRARLCAACIVDEAGERLFSDADMDALGRKSGAALDRVFSVAQRLSGMTEADVKSLQGNS
jgi:hypothetical protein